MSIEEEQKLVFSPDERPQPPAKNLLPKKYESEISSGLTHTVASSPTRLDIRLD